LKDSTESRKEQKTLKGGWPKEVGLETGDTSGAHQAEAASEDGNDDVQMVYTKDLLTLILEREKALAKITVGWIIPSNEMIFGYCYDEQ